MEKKFEVVIRYLVDKSNVNIINALIEGYEEVAIVRVIDKKEGIMELYTSSDYEEDSGNIIKAIREEYGIMIKELSRFRYPVDLDS
ncbi:MAG: DUF4911 domain-containing protein [Thermosulfidibacteraceae bacterium]|jgi:polynucleotide 5'-kinase involved in rRNA processing